MSAMTEAEVRDHLHHPDSTPPPVRPCDTPSGSDKKTNWSAEELHRIMGCRKFKDYKQLLRTTRDGRWVDAGEFPLSLGAYATIPKNCRGSAIDRRQCKF